MKLKNLNRGLVLGAVLIVGTVVYVTANNISFKKSKPDIEEAITESVEALVQSNVGTGDSVVRKWKTYLNSYMVDYSYDSNNFTKSDIMSEINSGYYNTDDGEILKSDVSISDIRISKSGSSGANVSFNYSLYYEFTGSEPSYLSFDGMEYLDGDGYNYYGNLTSDDSDEAYSESFDGTAEFYMKQVDGVWKIATMQTYGYSIGVNPIETTNTDDDTDINFESDVSSSQAEGEEVESVGE